VPDHAQYGFPCVVDRSVCCIPQRAERKEGALYVSAPQIIFNWDTTSAIAQVAVFLTVEIAIERRERHQSEDDSIQVKLGNGCVIESALAAQTLNGSLASVLRVGLYVSEAFGAGWSFAGGLVGTSFCFSFLTA
jgi:hypothetical protein